MPIIGNINEDFWRCPECNNPYFYPREKYLIEKDMYNKGYDFNEKPATILERKFELECTKCGKKITREELIEHEQNKTE